jgi:hypothetical protein
MSIVVKYQINLHSLRNKLEKISKGSLIYLFLKLARVILIVFIGIISDVSTYTATISLSLYINQVPEMLY